MAAVLAVTWASTVLGAPRLVCEDPVFDFGERDSREKVEHAFTIANNGNENLRIKRISTTCGCTVAKVQDRDLAPGESAEVRAVLDLQGRRGKQRKGITVRSNDPQRPVFQLMLTGTAIQRVDIQPRYLSFGRITGKKVLEKEAVITLRVDEPVRFTGIDVDRPEAFAAELVPVADSEKPAVRVLVSTKTGLPPGVYSTLITVRTSHETYRQVEFRATASVADTLTLLPRRLVLRDGHTPDKRYIVVSPGRIKTFKITKVDLPSDTMKADVTALRPNHYRLVLTGFPPSDTLRGKHIVIHTNRDDMPTVQIPVKIVKPPQIHRQHDDK